MKAEQRCPLCEGANRCGQLEGAADCWCQSLRFDPQRLADLPDSARGRCLCRSCATGSTAETATTGGTSRFT